jgi:hypothetical protein
MYFLWFIDKANGYRLNGRIILVHLNYGPEVKSAVVKGDEQDHAENHAENQGGPIDQVTASDNDDTTGGDTDTDTDTDSEMDTDTDTDNDTRTDTDDDSRLGFIYLEFGNDDCSDDEDYMPDDCEMEDDDDGEYSYHESEDEVVEILDQCTFSVHESVLRSNSPYFERALRADWEEGRRGEVHLGNFDPNAFEIYARWAYTGRVLIEIEQTYLWKLCYELGQYVCDSDFNDALMDILLDGMTQQKRYYPNFLYEVMYKMPRKDSPHRRLAVDVFLLGLRSDHHTDSSWMPDFTNTGLDFVRDVVMAEKEALRKEESTRRGQEDLWLDWKNDCRYHEHATGGKCYKERKKHLYGVLGRNIWRLAAGSY